MEQQETKKLKPLSVEVNTRVSGKGNTYSVLSLKVLLMNDDEYVFETFLSNEQLKLLRMVK